MGKTDRKNVIIVGAGASKEFGLPTGNELKDQIAKISDIRFDDWGSKLVSGDHRLVQTLRQMVNEEDGRPGNINPLLHEAWRIRDNMHLAPSIDNFLDTHNTNENLVRFGKLAIVCAILKAEQKSILYINDQSDPDSLNMRNATNTWLGKFFTILVAQRDIASFVNALENITFISFNYDRCIQQFLTVAAKQYFNLGNEELEAVYNALNIIYPYGTVGEFQEVGNGRNSFGKEVFGHDLITRSESIKTFTEGVDAGVKEKISTAFTQANLVMFMGFGFLRLNMDLLFCESKFVVDTVLATAKGLSINSTQIIRSELNEVFKRRIYKDGATVDLGIQGLQIENLKCADMIFEFQRLLSS